MEVLRSYVAQSFECPWIMSLNFLTLIFEITTFELRQQNHFFLVFKEDEPNLLENICV